MSIHTVQSGETIASIANEYGFFAWTIWNHSRNAELKKLRETPQVLFPGDQVFVPEKRRKGTPAATGERHRFIRKGVPATFRVRFLKDEAPLAGKPYVFVVEGSLSTGVTDGAGQIEQYIPPGARSAEIHIEECNLHLTLDLGCLDPVTESSGVKNRLANLGYPVDSDSFEVSLRQFQNRAGIKETGIADAATQAALVREHDCR